MGWCYTGPITPSQTSAITLCPCRLIPMTYFSVLMPTSVIILQEHSRGVQACSCLSLFHFPGSFLEWGHLLLFPMLISQE